MCRAVLLSNKLEIVIFVKTQNFGIYRVAVKNSNKILKRGTVNLNQTHMNSTPKQYNTTDLLLTSPVQISPCVSDVTRKIRTERK